MFEELFSIDFLFNFFTGSFSGKWSGEIFILFNRLKKTVVKPDRDIGFGYAVKVFFYVNKFFYVGMGDRHSKH